MKLPGIFHRLSRRIYNSGYDEGGASRLKNALKGYIARSASPTEDIDRNLDTLRARSRELFMNSPFARAPILTARTNITGSGLKLKVAIDGKYLGLSEEKTESWKNHVKREFELWAESKHSDALHINNFYENQQLAQLSWLLCGDCFVLLKEEKPQPYMPYGLRLHLLEADRICTPGDYINGIEGVNPENGNRIISGVEIDKNGTTVAYWISNRHPGDTFDKEPVSFTRVEPYGRLTGRTNILHLMESERPEARRGVPYLSSVILTIKQLTRYNEAEVMAAVISSMFTLYIRPKGPQTDGGIGMDDPVPQVPANYANELKLGNGAVRFLAEGDEVVTVDPKRPNPVLGNFIDALIMQIGASLEMSGELIKKQFSGSYSSARAELLEAWKMFRMRREWLANDFCQPVYEAWLTEAVAMGRIEAPGFFEDPVIRKAWSNAQWNGPSAGQIDPLKEASAARMRIEMGISTREREAMELNGSDFNENAAQLRYENKQMGDVGGIEPEQ